MPHHRTTASRVPLRPLRPHSGLRATVLLLLALPAAILGLAADSDGELPLLERVAGWQLQQPCSFDIRWRAPGAGELQRIRLGWDGSILRRQTVLAPSPEVSGVPAAWTYLVRREAGDLAFDDLPAAAREGWRERTGLDPAHIVGLKPMEEGGTRGWEMGTLYVGLLALAQVAENPVYLRALTQLAEAQHWQLGPQTYHADDLLVGYLHLKLHGKDPQPERLAAVQARVDWLMAHPAKQSLDIRDGQDRWTWCDALFMAPPVWLQLWKATGDRRYLEFMDREWWATTDFLYSAADGLFYRDAKFFTQREPNGQKIFWSRGNAWVIASLALMLEDLPADLPARPRYVQLFQTLAARIAALQPTDGLWRSSLLDPAASPNPESSSTAFFCYAFARGIRLGLLDAEKYGPIVERTWTALQHCVQADGRLGFVQQPGAAPGSADEFSTAPYGVGAFLLAGAEVHLLGRERRASAAASIAPGASGTAWAPSPDFLSQHLALGLAPRSPAFNWFAVDSLGRGEELGNVVLTAKLPAADYRLRRSEGNRFSYVRPAPDGKPVEVWQVEAAEARIKLRSVWKEGEPAAPFLLLVDQKKNHATLLGLPGAEPRRIKAPCVLHLPDRGTFRITTVGGDGSIGCDARRRQPENFVRIEFSAATREHPVVEYILESTLIHPDLAGLGDNPRYDGYRRNFLNLIQLQPRLRTLANNSSSDVCGFTFWENSELGLQAPPLAPGLTVLDLVRVSLDRVFEGGLTYGQAGYGKTPENPEAAPWSPAFDSLDTLPSLVIASSQYIVGSGDRNWARERFPRIVAMGRDLLAQDGNGNGLIEYRLSGNAGTWDGKTRPANWWDTIGFGHEDAYANALAYRACLSLAEAARFLDQPTEAAEFTRAAQKIKQAYVPTFLNPVTGVLAGWKSRDGKLHDYWFTFVSGMAISFGLVEDELANAIVDRMLAKMEAVGFARFDLGLPGNLVPVRREDYTDKKKRYGGSELEDGSDGFQIYENGAATHCHAYWFVKALYKLGRVADARRIYYPMLRSFSAGDFQGFTPNGLSKDWRNWKGEGTGYEGYLTDGYLAILAVADDLNAATPRGKP